MPFISASAITPYNSIRGGAAGEALDPILAYSPYNVWDSEHVTINGNVTTVLDYNEVGTKFDLSNQTASTQPVLNSSGSFNGLPSISFNGATIIENLDGGFRDSDTTGMEISVWKIQAGGSIFPLTNFETGSSLNYMGSLLANVGNTPRMIIRAGSNLKVYLGSTDVVTGSPKVVFVHAKTSSGSNAYQMRVNNSIEILNFTNGNSTGDLWYGTQSGKNQLAIGGRTTTSTSYSNIEWCFSGYFPYVSEENTTEIVNLLMTKYGI